ncbi:DUF362 domain-containing protein [Candidatus Bathyarchaeota archaeon]|nr:DUF362 domain-containing protein [Candidatus Bathyarchaeota archaeon]
MHRVSIVRGGRAPSPASVESMVRDSIELLGGIKDFIKPGDTVALKPNVVTGRLSGRGVTTDPEVLKALIRLSYEGGAGKVFVVEGSGYGSPTMEALELSGVKDAAEACGARVVDVDSDDLVEVKVPNPLILDKIPVSKTFLESDVKINVPVMKTHDQMLMTLGMKNMKGIIPKPQKRLFHRIGLAKAIVDLNKAVPLDLTVVDAIYAMEGLGPSFGDIVEMSLILASRDVYSLDVIGSKVMGFDPEEVEYLKLASEQGLVKLDGSDIEVVGEPVERVARVFKKPPMDLAPQEGVRIIEKGACSACRGTIRSVFYDLEQIGLMKDIRDLTIIVGPQAGLPKDLDKTPLIMGTCLKHLENKGCYVIGCPPNNDQMIKAIRELCGKS